MHQRNHLPAALRKLARSPFFTIVAVVTLGIGIGANATVFSVVNGVLLKPLPYEEPERLVGVWHKAPGLGFDMLNQSPALHYTYRDENRVFESIGMWDNSQVSVTGRDEPEQVPSMNLTHDVLPMLRIRPMLGRVFSAEDDQPGAPLTAMVSWSYWQSRLGGDADVVGTTIRVNGRAREIIGVLPRGFRFLRHDASIFLPFQFDRAELIMGNFSYQGIARLRPGATIEQANADIERIVPIATEQYPAPVTLGMLREARFAANIQPLKRDVIGDIGGVLWVLFGTVGLVLLIACANVANLYLVRAEAMQREIAIRTAIGASRGRVARQLLAESVTLGVLGGIAATGIAWAGLRVLVRLAPANLPRVEAITIDPVVVLFTFALAVLAGVAFGLLPLLHYGRPNLVTSLKESGRGASDGRERHRTRTALAIAEVALALVLLVGSGLMVRSFQALRDVRPGFDDPEQVITLRVTVPNAEIEDGNEVVLAYEQVLDRMSSIPGVTSVGASSSITLDGNDSNDPIYVEDYPTTGEGLPPIRRFKWVGGDYFQTMGNPVIAGRAISWTDIHTRAPVVMITENLAREYWGDAASAIGRRVREFNTSPWREIVGVVGDIHDDGLAEPATATVYWPLAVEGIWQQGLTVQRSMGFALRVAGANPERILPQVREAVWSVNRNLPLANVQTLAELRDRSMARTSFTLVMLGIAAVMAVVLGMVGIYGVISYIVAQRTREIGVRMALGASTHTVQRMVLRQGTLYAGAGAAIGLVAAAGLTRLMQALLFGVRTVDPLTYATAALGVAAVSLLACYIPARRASGVDPLVALRTE